MTKKFTKINIEITNICNLQCSFCPEVIRPKNVMSLELFSRVIDEIAPYTDMVALHLMGDPLVHPKLPEIVEICAKKDIKIFFVTNGLLLKESHFETLLHPTFHQVNFSLHSFADNFGEKDPTPYLNRIFEFTDLAFEKRASLYINYRLWNLEELLGKKESNLFSLRKIEERFNVPLEQKITERKRKNVLVKNRLYLHFDTEFVWPGRDLPVLGNSGTCYGLSSHFGILADGTVVPCCLDKEGDIQLGNLKDTDLKTILNSERAQKIVLGFKNNILQEELCKRCQYIERFA